MKGISQCLLVDVRFRGHKTPEITKVYISPHPQDNTTEPIMMKLGELADFDEVIKCVKIGVNRSSGVSSRKV